MDSEPLIRQARTRPGSSFGKLFELNARDRLLPMEGLRGVAVSLVFLQHYCRQYVEWDRLTGFTAQFDSAFRNFGNRGVELFFVLSGFLIYGILIKKRPGFFDFMWRRAQRIYPAFLAAFLLGCLVDMQRAQPLIPHGIESIFYIAENLLFLPGLLPIRPVTSVNWSLSYEWWFYVSITALFSTFALSSLRPWRRVSIICAAGALLVVASALDVPSIPIRGLSLLAGMLLAEAEHARIKPPHVLVVLTVLAAAFSASVTGGLTEWQTAVLVATAFFLLCHHALFHQGALSRLLSLSWLRRLGNMSYSFYLVHGIVVVASVQTVIRMAGAAPANAVFWLAMSPILLAALILAALLFLGVEKPLSLQRRVPKNVSASAQTVSP
jgi:exopolysaccharide production protein ExoZ